MRRHPSSKETSISLVAQLRDRRRALWDQATGHPFPRELVAGTLPLRKFQRYLLQDYAFLRDFSTLLALGVAKAPDLATARPLAAFLSGVLAGEEGYFRRAFQEWGWRPPRYARPSRLPATRAMGDFMARVACEGSFAEVLTVLVVTESVYLDWASRAAPRARSAQPWYYQEWTAIHSNAEFRRFVGWLEATLDAQPLSAAGRSRVAELFETALRHELAFWEMGYGRGRS